MTAVLVLVLAACSTAGGDTTTTTTTTPLAEPSTTSTTAPSTTTTTKPTTTTVDECVDQDGDGVLRNLRGFVCPPALASLGQTPELHVPGVYQTRLFEPGLRFTRQNVFSTTGEHLDGFFLDMGTPGRLNPVPLIFVTGHHLAPAFAELIDTAPNNKPDDWNWVEDRSTTEVRVGGFPATKDMFSARCSESLADRTDEVYIACFFTLGRWDGFNYVDGQRASHVLIQTPTGPVGIAVIAEEHEFDTYWADTVEPILDSIEFLDP